MRPLKSSLTARFGLTWPRAEVLLKRSSTTTCAKLKNHVLAWLKDTPTATSQGHHVTGDFHYPGARAWTQKPTTTDATELRETARRAAFFF